MTIDIIGVKYDSKSMDFRSFIDEVDRTLFIFNDNWTDHYSKKQGGGNACVRPYNPQSGLKIPKSFGIPTGHSTNGYRSLAEGQQMIDIALTELSDLIKTGNYDRIVYSIDNYDNPLIGRGIFVIGEDVKEYITQEIIKLGKGGRYYFKSSVMGLKGPYNIDSI